MSEHDVCDDNGISVELLRVRGKVETRTHPGVGFSGSGSGSGMVDRKQGFHDGFNSGDGRE